MPSRRRILLGLAALALPSCRCGAPAPPPAGAWREIAFEPTPDHPDPQRALLLLPEGERRGAAASGAADLPVLVALHGRGESARGVEAGARGWRDDYRLDAILRRLHAPPLAAADLGDLVTPERLALLNASLERDEYRGLVIATPFTPDPRDRTAAGARPFARFVVDRLLARVRAEAGSPLRRDATGIDGVSLGGRLALLVGLSHPEVFGAVGALQPALRADEAEALSALARSAMERHPVALRLVSSDWDPFLPAIRAVSERLRRDGVAHELLVTPGPHDYAWNRGPGGVEMVLWHERVLRGLRPP
jgi:hypothetical protein